MQKRQLAVLKTAKTPKMLANSTAKPRRRTDRQPASQLLELGALTAPMALRLNSFGVFAAKSRFSLKIAE